jgi:hypothetical protein
LALVPTTAVVVAVVAQPLLVVLLNRRVEAAGTGAERPVEKPAPAISCAVVSRRGGAARAIEGGGLAEGWLGASAPARQVSIRRR